MDAVTSSGTATVTLPTDEQILITREFDAPKHLVYKAWTTPELVRRWWTAQARRDDDRRDRPAGRRHVALRDGGRRRVRGRLPRRVPRDRPERADRLRPRSTRACPTADEDAALNTVTFTEVDGRTTLTLLVQHAEQGDPRHASSTPGWRPACRRRWTSSSRSRSRCADHASAARATGTALPVVRCCLARN